jgi:hypothetical protein
VPPKKKPNQKRLTTRQKKYARERAKGKNKKQAALAAGYAESTARVAGAMIEARPEFQEESATALLDEAHQGRDHGAEVQAEGMDATETHAFAIGSKTQGTEHVEHLETPAWDTRLRYLQTYFELKGARKSPQKQTTTVKTGEGVTVIEVVTQEIGACAGE